MRGAQAWLVLAALIIAVASGIQVAEQAHQVRKLQGELEVMQRTQDELLAEYSRLLLERSTLAAYQNVERLAEQELGMRFPDTVERLEP